MDRHYARFIVLGQGRSGTTLLVQALNSLPSVVCFGEIFNASTRSVEFGVFGYESTGRDTDLRASDAQRFLRERIFCDHGRDVRVVGFKFHYEHFWRHEGLVEILARDQELKVVHLVRLNRLRTYVSLKIAETTGRWFDYAPEPSLKSRLNSQTLVKAMRQPGTALAAVKRRLAAIGSDRQRSAAKDSILAIGERTKSIHIDPKDFAEFCRRSAYSEKHWEEILSSHEIIRVTYEDLVADREHELARVQRFLGLEPATTEVALRKQNPESLRELIANYDELRAAFVGGEYEAFFDD